MELFLASIQDQIKKSEEGTGATGDIASPVGNALNVVYGVIGIIAVVMIILGGVSYATSQGDASKVKKGRDTIIYGVIGLIISILAFAITNFVLTAI